ncbi:MAG: DUF4041 domain-containing protein [Pseudomonadota bacterium]
MESSNDWIAISIALAFLASPIVAIKFAFQLRRRRRDLKELEETKQGEIAELQKKLSEIENRFSAVIDVEAEAMKAAGERDKTVDELDKLRAEYKDKKSTYDRLRLQVAVYDETIAFAELGVYEPHFDFGDSADYKYKIEAVRQMQKAMVKQKTAVVCHTSWTVSDSASKGETMVNRAIRLTLRAFNNECEAAIANVRWNNAKALEKRLKNAKKQIDKANASLQIEITQDYLDLKLSELRLTHEYREKLKEEREKRAEQARLEREEKRLLREAQEARKEEGKYEALLAKAREEAGASSSAAQEDRIRELEQQLREAHDKTERAHAMAEKTKSGFVYIITNIGSFGDDVVKIGLTRRLDPADRVRELGDASVPFLFDTHAMIYSEEAPALETALHSEFEDRRVNAANMRKEFFRVSLEEVEEAVMRLAPDAEFHKDIEAQEFNETLVRRREKLATEEAIAALEFPDEL